MNFYGRPFPACSGTFALVLDSATSHYVWPYNAKGIMQFMAHISEIRFILPAGAVAICFHLLYISPILITMIFLTSNLAQASI